MTRLPIIGSDDGTWGTILNEFLEVSHNSDGTLSSEALSSAGVILGTNVGQPGGVPSLSNTGVIPPAQLGSGSAGSTTYLRGDGSWQVPPGSGGSSTLSGDSDVSIVSPANNQVLTYDSSGSVWQNANLPVSVSTFNTRSGAVTLSKADVTATGLSYGDVGADAAGAAAAVSTTSIGALAKASNLSDVVSASSARTNLGLGTAATISSTAGGDLSGSLPSPMVVGLYGTPMNGNTPGGNDVMTYNSGSWGPAALPSAPVVSVAGKTGAVTLDEGDISNLTSDLSTIDGNITTLQGDVTTINSSLSSKYSGSNPPPYPVSTVFGRTGAVVATTGDYTVSEITGAAPLSSPTFTGTVSGITAAMVSNAADTSSASQQSFTGEVKVPDLAVAGLSGATAASRYVGATTSGAPGSGTFNKGDFVLDQTGTLWICTTAGSPGVWGQVSAGSATTAGSAGSATTAGSASPSGSAGGDLTGSYPNPTLSGTTNVESIIRANRLDQLTAPTTSVSMNSQKLTSLANGVLSTDAAAYGQIPTSLPPNGTAGGDLTGSYPNPTLSSTANVQSIINTQIALAAPTTVFATGAHSAAADERTVMTVSNTVTLPSAPVTGTTNAIQNQALSSSAANLITIARGGTDTITSLGTTGMTSMTIPQGSIATLVYNSGVWTVVSIDYIVKPWCMACGTNSVATSSAGANIQLQQLANGYGMYVSGGNIIVPMTGLYSIEGSVGTFGNGVGLNAYIIVNGVSGQCLGMVATASNGGNVSVMPIATEFTASAGQTVTVNIATPAGATTILNGNAGERFIVRYLGPS